MHLSEDIAHIMILDDVLDTSGNIHLLVSYFLLDNPVTRKADQREGTRRGEELLDLIRLAHGEWSVSLSVHIIQVGSPTHQRSDDIQRAGSHVS